MIEIQFTLISSIFGHSAESANEQAIFSQNIIYCLLFDALSFSSIEINTVWVGMSKMSLIVTLWSWSVFEWNSIFT